MSCIFSVMPSLFQVEKYPYTVLYGGKSCGRYSHAIPVRFTYKMAFTISRRSCSVDEIPKPARSARPLVQHGFDQRPPGIRQIRPLWTTRGSHTQSNYHQLVEWCGILSVYYLHLMINYDKTK